MQCYGIGQHIIKDVNMSWRYKNLAYIVLFGLSYAQSALANGIDSTAFIFWLKSSYVVTLSAGPSWENAGDTQTLNLAPEIIKTYAANNATHTLATGDLFVGVKTCLPRNLQAQVGLDVATTGSADLSGDIWDDASPEFNNYTYQYNIKHTHLALKGKLLGDFNLPIMPWISATIGVGYNRAYDFTSAPRIFQAVATPGFASNTTTTFTYALGVGVERQINPNWQFGLGYEFADWGRSELGAMPQQSSGLGLSLSHLYTHSLLLNVTYLA